VAERVQVAGWHWEQTGDGEWTTDLDISIGEDLQAQMCVWKDSGKWKAYAVTPPAMGEYFAYPLCEEIVRNSRDEAMKAIADWWHSHERTGLRFQLSVLGALAEITGLLQDSSIGEEAEEKQRRERQRLRMIRSA